MPTDTRGAVAMMKSLALDAKHDVPELPWMEAGLCGSIIITRARRSCSAYAGRDSLIARSDRPRHRWSKELDALIAIT